MNDNMDVDKIKVICVVGNHGRTTDRLQFANMTETSYEYFMYEDIKSMCEIMGLSKIEFIIPKAGMVIQPIFDKRVLFSHGNLGFSYKGGIGGLSVPFQRWFGKMKMRGQEMGLQLANLASQIKLNESQANKNNAEANKTAGVDTELAKTSIENLISQTKNEKDRNVLIWADKRFKEAAADMQEASAKLASGETAKIGYEIQSIMKSLDKMELEMKGIQVDNELKTRTMESKVQEAEMSVKALMNSILVGNSQIRLNNQEAEAITDKVMQDWQSVAQQWSKLQQSGQSIEIDRARMENEAKKILNDIVISGKKLTLEQQQQLLDVVLGLGGLATRMASVKGGQ